MRDGKMHVVIGVPTRDYNVSIGIPSLVAHLFHAASKPDCPFVFSFVVVAFSIPTETARNETVKQFLKIEDADVLWFVDSDALPSANSDLLLGHLIRDDVDICGVMTPFLTGLTDKAYQYNVYRWNPEMTSFNPLLPKENTGLIEVDGMGTPGMAIKRKVLEDKRLWAGEPDEKYGAGCPPIFRWIRAASGHTIMTDDLDFCMRSKQLGYRLWVDTAIRWGHVKHLDVMTMLTITSTAFNAGQKEEGHPPTAVLSQKPYLGATEGELVHA